jgi:hypothetical protein
LEILEKNGYLIESSAYKGDSYPYNPSANDWQVQGEMEILRVPVSNAPDYLYSFFYYESSWIDAFEYLMEEQKEKDIKIMVIGLHPWELCELDLPEGYEETERICGDATHDMLVELLEYLKDKDVNYITLSESYELFR